MHGLVPNSWLTRDRDQETPRRHGRGVLQNNPYRSHDGRCHANMAVEQQRERHHAQGERHDRENEADGVADSNEAVAFRGGEHLAGEGYWRDRFVDSECRDVNRMRDREPDSE